MIVYQSSKLQFLDDVICNSIESKIEDQYIELIGRTPAPNEVTSWRNSMMYMHNVVLDTEIPEDCNISIEFQIPLTSKRIDFIITGLGSKQEENVVIIELKQWSSAKKTTKDGIVETRFQHGVAETAHPSYQAWSYATTISNFNATVEEESIQLVPCAYLHNYAEDHVIKDPFYQYYLDRAPVFLREDTLKLREFIKKHIKYGDRKNVMFRIENGKIRPSKQLADAVASMLSGNEEFIMIDDQKVVFETAKELALKAHRTHEKEVLIVEGGPGTGKSVVAINLLVEFQKMGLLAKYVSKNAAPRTVYAAKLSGSSRKSIANSLFGGSGAYIDTKTNYFDALVVDEAHRLNLKSGLYGNLGMNQVLEIINAAKCAIFFIDDYQRIHINDIGEVAQIEEWAKMDGARVTKMQLQSQFRCNGSDGYLAWLDNTLGIRETANTLLSKSDFDFRVYDDANDLREMIEERNKKNNKSRMVAGYCWDWKSRKNPKEYDVVIPSENFKMRWNLTKDGSAWIIAEDSINEIGCIHTCQGLELDYVGVIIGDDLLYRNGKIIANVQARSYMDQSIRGIKKMLKEDPAEASEIADRIIKNTYRTLLTRGMKGCYIYCTDAPTRDYFRSKLKTQSYRSGDELRLAAEDTE